MPPAKRSASAPPVRRNPERTSAAILAAATHEFATKGYGGAAVNEIARRAEVNKRMIYHYFGNKEALYIAVFEAAYADIRTAESRLRFDESDPVEAIRATGASPPQVLAWGIWPQVTPAFAGISIFRWDINIREATVLGLVGAGGIGMNLESSMNTLAWPQVTLILLVILATVVVSEWVSARVRHAII